MWEYLTLVSSSLNLDLNKQGRLCWELVAVVPFDDGTGARFYFKRKAN